MNAPVLDDPAPFDLAGPLPSGTVVLEASAGTGKTYTIAGLATRWVAETDARLPNLLIVTFTRAATAELRDRVRARLVEAADHLEAVLAGTATDTADPVLAGLADGDDARVRLRHARLSRALTDVDAATIATIHGFCQHVLDGFGIASDLDRDAELVDDLYDLVEEVVDDLLVSTYVEQTDHPRIPRGALVELGRAVVGNPGTRLAPRAPNDPEAGFRLHLATAIRAEVTRRARQRRLLSYDGLLERLDKTLRDHDLGPAAREALRRRYRVALIDEFQDTDPVQWSIVSQAFVDAPGDGVDGRALVLIGDPKQAIYAFRGADVHAYLQASRQAGHRHTLGTSWRADAGLLDACGALFDGVTFGHDQIPFRPVGCAPGHDAPRLIGAPDPAPLRLRLVPRHPSLPVFSKNKPVASDVRELIAADVAADIVRLLDAEPQLIDRDRHGGETSRRPLRPADIAVLVRSHREAGLVQTALGAVDVPSVVGGAGSVFATPAATDWRRLLDALERPASANRVRALALTNWIGWTADDLAHADEDALDDLHEAVHRWARLLADHGVAVTVRTVQLERGVAQRLLATETGERLLADLDHIGELAHAAAAAEHLGPPGIAAWLRDRIAEASDESSDDRLRRLETDHDAVQISTVHGAKGLEFPVVHCPFLWSSRISAGDNPVFHDEQGGRHLDVGGDHADHAAHKAAAEGELQGEELRLLYVALTRAKHQAVVWYAPAGMPEWSGLGRLLLCRNGDGPVTDMEAPIPDDEEAAAAAARLAARADGTIAIETVPEHPSAAPWRTDRRADVDLDRARFTRDLDDAWRRTSYTALTRLTDPAPRVGSEPDERVKDDEDAGPNPVDAAPDATDDDPSGLRDVELPLADMPGGTHVGTFVHRVLERTDFAADGLPGELADVVDAELQRTRLDLDRDVLVAGLDAAVRTPLGPAFGDVTLRDVTRRDRRDEVGFELPLDGLGGDGGDAAGRAATVGDVVRLLRDHLAADDPLRAYPDTVPDPLLGRSLRGYLNGSIDLVLRREVDGAPVFHVVDYKTNWLGTVGVPLTAWDYRPAALVGAMAHGHYPIQALLYGVAVHRMLRWRLPGYDPATHLGAIGYLFLRGMVGPDAPAPDGVPCGVFAWTPPAALVAAASDLLHGVAQ